MFSSVCALPSPASAESCLSLFGWFTGVGSEEARLRASLRPPLKLHVQFSRMQLLRRLNHCGKQEKELTPPSSQAHTHRTTSLQAVVSNRHCANV